MPKYCLLVYIMLHISIKVLPKWLSKHELNKDDIKGHAKVHGKKHMEFQPYTKNYRKKYNYRRKLVEGDVVLPREEHSNLLFSAKWSPLKNILFLIEISRCFHSIHVYTVLKTRLYLITLCFVASFKTIFILILSTCHACMQVMYFDHIKHFLPTNPPISTSHNTPNLISSLLKYIT